MKKRMFVLAMALTLALALPASAQGPGDWTEYPENPVFGQGVDGPKAYYPSVLYDADEFSDHGHSAKYKMWYGTSSGKVGFAYSDDGIAWEDSGLVTGNVRYHSKVLYDPEGFGGTTYYYKMWYANPDIWPYRPGIIRYAESTDGTNWVNDQPISQNPSKPLYIGACGWWYGTYGPGAVLYNPDGYDTWHDDDPMGHEYVMYYDVATMNCIPGETESTALAYSLDGVYWRRYGDQPVILSGPDGAWDAEYVYAWTVLKDDDSYHMWYSGGVQASHEGIGYATSSDGINWTRDANSPIFRVGDGIGWRDSRTYCPAVLKDRGSYKMWFAGQGSGYSIGYATAAPPVLEVDIDIKPGSDPNSINLGSKGVVPVAVLTTDDFDASTVDPGTVEFAGAQPVRWAMEDMDGDGDLDLLFHFKTQELNLTDDSTEAPLTGETLDGMQIEGTDTVNIVPKGK